MNDKKKLVVVISEGLDNERSSVAWSITVGGINSGLDVSVFLVSSGVDWVRKGAANRPHLNPEDPTMSEMINLVIESGTTINVCPPCIKVRGYEKEDLIDGVTIAGSVAGIHEHVSNGAAVLSF